MNKMIIIRYSLKLTFQYLVNTCNIFYNVNVDTHILMTISLLPLTWLKLIKIWQNIESFLHFYIYYQTENREFIRTKIHKTRILTKVGNMTLLPSPGKPGFYGEGLPRRVISCQLCILFGSHGRGYSISFIKVANKPPYLYKAVLLALILSFTLLVLYSFICFCTLVAYVASNLHPDQTAPLGSGLKIFVSMVKVQCILECIWIYAADILSR